MALDTITPANIRALNTQFSGVYQAAYDAAEVHRERLATTVPSTSKSNTYGWMTKLPKMREWLGERVIHGLAAHGYQIENKDWELTVGVDRNDFEDDNLGIYRPVVQQTGDEARKHPDDLIFDLMRDGHLATAVCFDGQNFFDTDHPVDSINGTGTQSNYFTGTTLDATNLFAKRAEMMEYKGENGRPLRVVPNLLVVPPALEKTAREILVAATAAAGATNVAQGLMDYLVAPDLGGDSTEDKTWYLLDTRKPIKPFVFQTRKAPAFVQKTAVTDDNVFMTKTFLWGVDARYNAGYGPWFLAAKCVGS